MKKFVLYILVAALCSSCHIYKEYQRPEVDTEGLFRDTLSMGDTLLAADTLSFGNLPWREVFRDPCLQKLIEQGLTGNIDLRTAQLRVEQAGALLLSSKLSYLPSVSLSPEGTLSHLNGHSLVLVTTPTWHAYYDRLDNKQLEKMYNLIHEIQTADDLPYYDYLKDPRFTADDFYNSDHLSDKGAKKFTDILISDFMH